MRDDQLSIHLVWHPADNEKLCGLRDICMSHFLAEGGAFFSRCLGAPFFIWTSKMQENIPRPITDAGSIIFFFSSLEVVADDEWETLFVDISRRSEVRLIPVALDKPGLKAPPDIDSLNFIRAFDYLDTQNGSLKLFISITHEICRWGFNTEKALSTRGKESAIRLFLSHAKADSWAIQLAEILKKYIDSSQMVSFFDACDIGPGKEFALEIERHLEDSALISIHSDNYSGRYWCQQEMLIAKERLLPIVAVNNLKVYEDRIFPYCANIPSIHLDVSEIGNEAKQLKILAAVLVEYMRDKIQKKQLQSFVDTQLGSMSVLVRTRPPEPLDIINEWDNCLSGATILYPDPPIYPSEKALLCRTGVKAETPSTISFSDSLRIQGKRIGISISEPDEDELQSLGMTSEHLKILSQEMARHLVRRGASLLYGGDLREDGFTQFLVQEAEIQCDRMQKKNVCIENYQAWPIYLKHVQLNKEWRVKYKGIMAIHEVCPPEFNLQTKNSDPFSTIPEAQYLRAHSLSYMRSVLDENSEVRICAGGKLKGYSGVMPGVLEEILNAIASNKPLFLLGGFGGVTKAVCSILDNPTICQERLTDHWQSENNPREPLFLTLLKANLPHDRLDYAVIVNTLIKHGWHGVSKANGLSIDENKTLARARSYHSIVPLLLKSVTANVELKL